MAEDKDTPCGCYGTAQYTMDVLRTESVDFGKIRGRMTDSMLRLLHAALGACTEAAELADMVKKHLFYGKPMDTVNIDEELGDLLWYVAVACDVLGIPMLEIMQANIEKLRKRYPVRFEEGDALNRDVANELSHMGTAYTDEGLGRRIKEIVVRYDPAGKASNAYNTVKAIHAAVCANRPDLHCLHFSLCTDGKSLMAHDQSTRRFFEELGVPLSDGQAEASK
jgi:NTP pyrophosphatase (non-canonical NTP hydrolase)